MNIILCSTESLGESGMIKAIKAAGHTLYMLTQPVEDLDYDQKYLQNFASFIQKRMSTTTSKPNYQPEILDYFTPDEVIVL